MDESEQAILATLDALTRTGHAASALESIALDVVRVLAASPGELLAWRPVPLAVYQGAMPGAIRSSWVFVLRARSTTGAERHSNSHQRMVSFRGRGDFQTKEGGAWVSHHLTSEPTAGLEQRWISIPPAVWHQGVVGDSDWVVVSFHTAPESELAEEREGEGGEGVMARFYVGRRT